MKISIRNFKAIKSLRDFDFKPFNIVSGVNSSGKSSFIQFLLMIKQTIENGREPLLLNGLIPLGSFEDIVYKHSLENHIGFDVSLSNEEFSQEGIEYLSLKDCQIKFEFSYAEQQAFINTFEIIYFLPTEVKNQLSLKFIHMPESGTFKSITNSGAFNNELHQVAISKGEDFLEGKLDFDSFLPRLFTIEVDNENYPELDKNPTKELPIEPRLEGALGAIRESFQAISYLGPLREAPKDSYKAPVNTKEIGSKGEFVAYILEKEADTEIHYFKMVSSEGGPTYTQEKAKLVDAVNFWICDVFELAKVIYAEEIKEEYVVYIKNHFDVTTTIKHVGFGISQVLPIIVEGLRIPEGGMLILEQPEIHLHPRIQSLLFDFLYTLTLAKKRIVVETHSDHFIIRMRRRIAENTDSEFHNQFNLLFIEERETEHLFRKLDLTELGSLSYFPKNFVEQQDNDYRAIVKAQAKKRTTNS